jgi:antitoxin component YwqK of YwqJK toxin-antitoxin module
LFEIESHMKKINTFGLGTFTILLILVVMGIPLWVYFFGDGSLPSIKYLFFSLIFFGVILLVIISNVNQLVGFYNLLVEVDDKSKQSEEKEDVVKIRQVEEFHDNGYLKLVGTYLDEKKDGEWKFYNESGDLVVTGKYKNGKKDGIWVEYHKGGEKIFSKQFYQDGKIIDSILETYGYTGKLLTRGYLQDGKKHGLWETYFENGDLISSGVYKNGKESGVFIKYYNSRMVEYMLEFSSPKNFTIKHYYDKEGEFLREEGCIKDLKRHGDWLVYDESGNLKHSEEFYFGRKTVFKFFSEMDGVDWTNFLEYKFGVEYSFILRNDSDWYGKLL